jgi:hypothetical protein
MHCRVEYDALLKSVFQDSANCFVPGIAGCRAVEQLTVEAVSFEKRSPDLVIEAGGRFRISSRTPDA